MCPNGEQMSQFWRRTAPPGTCSPHWLAPRKALLLVSTHDPSVTDRNIHMPFLRTWLEPPHVVPHCFTHWGPFCCMVSMPWEARRELLMHHEDRQGKKGPSGVQPLPLPQLRCPRSPAAHAAPPPALQSCPPVTAPSFSTPTRLAGPSELLWHQLTQACSK